MLSKTRRRRTARHTTSDAEDDEEGDEKQRKRREKKKKEAKEYKSAQFIEDSDMEDDVLEAFFAKEKALREKMALVSAESGKLATMKSKGTKKRRRGKKADSGEHKRTVDDEEDRDQENEGSDQALNASSDEDLLGLNQSIKSSTSANTPSRGAERHGNRPKPRPKPRPRPRLQKAVSPTGWNSDKLPSSSSSPSAQRSDATAHAVQELSDDDEVEVIQHKIGGKRRPVVVTSDDED